MKNKCKKCERYTPEGCIKCGKSSITFNRCPWNKGMSSSELLSQKKELWVSGSQESKYHKYPSLRYPNIYSIKYKNGVYCLKRPEGSYRNQYPSRLWFWQGFPGPY